MNAKLKLAHIISRSSSCEQGAVLPVVLGLGLVMTLVGATMIIRSSDEQKTAVAQSQIAKALSAAEVGVARYQALIQNNRTIAVYNDCEGVRDSNGNCPDTGSTTYSWANAMAIANLPACSSTTGATVVAQNSTLAWQHVNPANTDLGQYRLVDYIYPAPGTTGTTGEPPGTGQLIVEGRSRDGAVSRLAVSIPVLDLPLTGPVAGLWTKNAVVTDMRNDKVKGDIVVTSCPPMPTGSGQPTTANVTAGYSVIADPQPFPDTPDLPPSGSYTPITISAATAESLPRTGDVEYNGAYHYLISELTLSGGDEINVDAGKNVVFYVQGNIVLSGNPDINASPSNDAANFQIYGNTYVTSSTTKYGCGSLTLNTNCPTLTAHFNGTGTMKTFLHAPDATGSVNGGGSTDGNFIGSMWLKDWDASSGNSKIKINAEGNFNDYLGSEKIDAAPGIASTSSWERREVN